MRAIYFSAEHEQFRRTVRDYMEREVAPHAEEWERLGRIPREAWGRLGEMGFLGLHLPEEDGGTGADLFYSLVFLEELARSRMGGFCAAVGVQAYIATGAIAQQGSEELRERYLRPGIEGRSVGAIAISEPDTGSDVAAIRTTAVREGDEWVIDGAKTWITNGVHGDFIVVACKTDPEGGHGGISLLVVDADTPGLKRGALRKVGWHSSDTAELSFEGVRVPAGNLIGEENAGFRYIMQTFTLERLVAAATAVGSSVLALEETIRYLHEREAFGKPIARFQALRHRVADLSSELEAARQLVYHAAWLYEQGEPGVREAAMAKLLTTELGKRIIDECLQLHGAAGYMEEYPIARWYRDARVATIVAGTSEIMREIIARAEIDGVEFPRPADPFPPRERGTGDREQQAATPDVAPPPRSSVVGRPSSVRTGPTEGRGRMTDDPGGGAVPGSISEAMRMLPARLRADRAEGWSSRLHFRFRGSPHPEWTVVVDGADCRVAEGLEGAATCVVDTKEETFLGIATGRTDPQVAFLTGRVKVSSLGEMLRFLKVFPPLRGS